MSDTFLSTSSFTNEDYDTYIIDQTEDESYISNDIEQSLEYEDSETPNKRKSSGKMQSFVWKFFDFYYAPASDGTFTIKHVKYSHHVTKLSLNQQTAEEIMKNTQTTIIEYLQQPHGQKQQHYLAQYLLKLIFAYTLPLSIVNNTEFRKFCHVLDSRFQVPGVDALKMMTFNVHDWTVNLIKSKITETAKYVALTLDIWSSRAHDAYLGITCHWITPEFTLYEVVLDIIDFPEAHTATEIITKLELQFTKFNLTQENIVSITSNNRSNVKAAISQLQITNIFCAAHTLQLSLQPSINHLCSTLQNHVSSVVQREGKILRRNLLSAKEFSTCAELVNILDPFDDVTEMLSGSKYPTLGVVTPAIKELERRLSAYETENEIILEIKNTILENLNQRWGTPSDLGLYGSFFDPRFKKLLFVSNYVELLEPVPLSILSVSHPASTLTEPTNNKKSKMLSFFHSSAEENENESNEFDRYLDQPQLLATEENNPLDW
ncbi:5280_t:CDS:2 [Ambispora gerdemannii]|uniref:5280_t:CDS:1 n=1 Tax=Ambispora gerdemannii TaxID=144530 RepID=A0A9N8Z3R5_9GLOM|nr:5280_t:CDS:2 [Ambispora gerdemannii]